MTEMETMDAAVDRAQAGTRFHLLLTAVFAGIAAALAAVGLYGVLAGAVRQRTAELGVRMALGAAPARIFKLVVGQGLVLSAAGVAVGIGAALALTRGMRGMLVGVEPGDPLTFVVMALAFFAVAAAAAGVPARRAAHLDAASALREE